ncbi:MAG: zf-HC2 domain-containing protein [Lachnospiraceae bacterium]|nr:zf-HC2 domain-containing protein [Lachnospiraceae bacterium]
MVYRKMWQGMNCKEAEKKIPSFLQDDLDGSKLEEFVEHVENCSECKEELSIQFLVTEGLERLEEGNNFNLQEELLMKLEFAEHRINVHRMLWYILLCLEAAVAAAIIIALCVVFRL